VPCPAQAPGGILNININFGFEIQTGPDGAFQLNLPPNAVSPGGGLELAMYDASDHRVFRNVYRTQGRIFIRTDRVAGRVNPLEEVAVTVRSAAGAERARGTITAGATGLFDGRVADTGGQPIAIASTDTVELRTAAEAPVVTVEPLAFDWSPGGQPVVGQAPPGRTVQVLLRLDSGEVYGIPRTTDPAGTFRLGPADLPPRASWTMQDVVAVRVVLPTPDGHQIISQTDDFEGGGPVVDHRTVYLPFAQSPRPAAAASAQAPSARAPSARAPSEQAAPRTVPTFPGRPHASLRVDPREAWTRWGAMLRTAYDAPAPYEARAIGPADLLHLGALAQPGDSRAPARRAFHFSRPRASLPVAHITYPE
jgi:hypothetical protein